MSGEVWQVVVFDDGGEGWSWRAIGRDGLAIVASEVRHTTPEGAEQQARDLFPTAQVMRASGRHTEPVSSAPPAPTTPYPRAAALAEESGQTIPGDVLAGVVLASWGRRAVALLLDGVVLVGFFVLLFLIAAAGDPSFDSDADPLSGDEVGGGWALVLLGWVFGPSLYVWLTLGKWGQTFGKWALGVRVVREDNAQRIGYGRALGRVLSVWVLALFYLPIIISYLWPLWDSRNQTLQDKMASTIVVRV